MKGTYRMKVYLGLLLQRDESPSQSYQGGTAADKPGQWGRRLRARLDGKHNAEKAN